MRPLLPLLVVVLVAPSVVGQAPVVEPSLAVFVEDPGRAFLPGSTEMVTVVVNYGPGQAGRAAPAPSADRPEDTAPTRIALAAKAVPSWVSGVSFEPAEVLVKMGVENASTSTYSRRAVAFLNVSADAPALVREPFVVTATAAPNGNMQGASAESPEIKLRAATVGKLNVSAEPLVVASGGRWTTIAYTVRNEGNSEIVAKLNVTVRPENSQVRFPETLQLARGESSVVEVEMRTPWTNAEFGTLELEAVPIVDGEEGTAARHEVEVRGQSAVPGVSVLALVALVGFLAASRRRS